MNEVDDVDLVDDEDLVDDVEPEDVCVECECPLGEGWCETCEMMADWAGAENWPVKNLMEVDGDGEEGDD